MVQKGLQAASATHREVEAQPEGLQLLVCRVRPIGQFPAEPQAPFTQPLQVQGGGAV